MRYGVTISLGFSLVFMPGCSLFAPDRQAILVTASDPQAKITVDNELIGTGAATAELKRNREHVVIAKVGDRSGTARIDKHISTTGVLDLVGGCIILVPFLGAFGPGFWTLEPQSVNVLVPNK